jgi:cyclohexanecarboxylate-CoA ligase
VVITNAQDLPVDHVPTGSGPLIAGVRPSTRLAAYYRSPGVWRDATPLDDLRRWREETPEATALTAHRTGSGTRRLSYQEYAWYVERFAAALYELGVRPGQVVAVQLPNWWQTNVLVLACARVGAVVAPIITSIRSRELERMLARLSVTVCVTVDQWAGFDHAAALAEMAPRLPELRHRIVLGERVADDEVDFVRHFQETPWEQRHPMPLDEADEDPDRVALVLFTSGTSGEPKGILHSFNTLYASYAPVAAEMRLGGTDTFFTPHSVTHIFGTLVGILAPVLEGSATVLLDVWDPEVALTLLAETATSFFAAAPPFISGLIAAAGAQPADLPALRVLLASGTTIPGGLVPQVAQVFGLPLRAAWGMTESPVGTWTRAEDPPDWSTRSDGRPGPGVELDLRADGEVSREQPAQLFIRSGGVCLATLGRDSGELRVLAEHGDGWYDTGDLVVSDGRGGIRIIGRVGDRIGGAFLIPVNDVETELLNHPLVDDVALVGYLDDTGFELACAVVVARRVAPALAELREHLDAQGMTDWYQPSRLELVTALPRNATGKVRKELLRRWLRGEAELTAG